MFARCYRLIKSRDIQSVLKRGRYRHISSLFLIKWLKNDYKNHRITIIASTKVSKRAVDRNRIRRRLTNNIPGVLLQGPTNYDIVIVAKKDILKRLDEAHELFLAFLPTLNIKHAKKN